MPTSNIPNPNPKPYPIPPKNLSFSPSFLPLLGVFPKSRQEIYFNNDSINNKINKEYNFSILSVNVCSLNKKLTKLKQITNEIPTDIICCQEVFQPHTGYVSIKNFHPILTKLRDKKRGGGVGIYVDKKHTFTEHEQIKKLELQKIEAIGINILLNRTKYTIISIYRPPNTNQTTTIEDLEKIINACENEKIVIVGDMNIDLSQSNIQTKLYLKTLQELGMHQHVRAYTRLTATTNTIIDHTISNIIKIETMVCHQSLSDHQVVVTCFGSRHNKIKAQRKSKNQKETIETKTETKQIHYKASAENIQNYNWKEWLTKHKDADMNKTYESFDNILQSCIVKVQKGKNKEKIQLPYITKNVANLRIQTEKARKKFLKKNNEANELTYKNLNKNYTYALRKAKNDYYNLQLKNSKNDIRKTWSVINQLLNRKNKTNSITSIIYNDNEITDPIEIANTFNTYYRNAAINKITKPSNNNSFKQYLQKDICFPNSFSLKKIYPEDTWSYIKSIPPKTSSGIDNIPSKLIHMCAKKLLLPLTTIINKCFNEGSFPTLLKTSKITPLLKREPKKPGNFRPLNQLTFCSKLIEKPAAEQLTFHIKTNINDNWQFGFQKKHNTAHAALLTRHNIEKELNKGNFVCLILLDLTLAFDTINTGYILPSKLKHYGADEKTVNFFKTYFTGRSSIVKWNGYESQKITLTDHSCVQGSCLGPPIYNNYTQCIDNAIDTGTMIRFADDTNIIIGSKNLDNLIDIVNGELEKISKYTIANNLIINSEKSQYMIFKPEKRNRVNNITNKQITINGKILQEVSEARYLGVIFDNKLSFKHHTSKVLNKLRVATNALRCTRYSLTYKAKILIYHSLFASHLDYCSIVWQDKLNKTQWNEITKLQKKAIRICFNAKNKSHTGPLLKLAKVIPADKTYERDCIQMVYKSTTELTKPIQPPEINKLFQSDNKIHNTRLGWNTNRIRINSKYKKGQTMYNIINEWNKHDNQKYGNMGNLFVLKQELKEDYLNNIKPCEKTNCKLCELDINRNYKKYMEK